MAVHRCTVPKLARGYDRNMKKTLNRQSGSAGRAASLRVIADRLAVADALYRTSQGSRGLSGPTSCLFEAITGESRGDVDRT